MRNFLNILRTFVCVAFESIIKPDWRASVRTYERTKVQRKTNLFISIPAGGIDLWVNGKVSWPRSWLKLNVVLTFGYVTESTNWPSMPSRMTDTRHVITPNSIIVLHTGCDCWITLFGWNKIYLFQWVQLWSEEESREGDRVTVLNRLRVEFKSDDKLIR